MDAIAQFFGSTGFMPHGYCFHWSSGLLWTYVGSDAVIALSYYSIPVALWTFTRRRAELPFSWAFLMFASFILACGTTHLIAILNIWQPEYWLDAGVKTITAIASLSTAVAIWPLMPKALALPGVKQLEAASNDLLREVAAHRKTEEELQALNRELEHRVAQRTAELERAADALRRKSVELEHALQSLRDSEERMRQIVDTALDAVVTMDSDGVVVGWNPQAAAIFGWSADEALGRSMSELIIPHRYREAHTRALQRYLETGEAKLLHQRIEWTALHRDGHEFPVELAITPIGVGTRRYFSGFLRDITARKETERALRDSEKRFRATFEQAAVGIAHVSPDGRWLRVNQKLCDIVSYTREELLALTFQDITHPDDLDADLAQVRQVLDGQIDTYTMEKRYFRKDHSEVWIELTVALMRDDAGKPSYFISVVADIAERKRAEEALRISREELRRLSAHIQKIREEEMARIARELHDDFGQQLTALKMAVTLLEHKKPAGPERLISRNDLSSIYALIDQLINSVRRFAADLRPAMLDDLGLIPAIDWLIEEFSARYHVHVTRHIDAQAIHFNRESRVGVFRIVQEALTNVARHSAATEVVIDITRDDSHCIVRIADNGRGAVRDSSLGRRSFGLLGMRERAALLGGDTQIRTSPGAGFVLTVTLPLAAVEAQAVE
ncbi:MULTISPECIES: PAS domain S-box protein [unclassified Burkholderia]|uniref:PAS domain-containing sensor histidine kinase n=1 Tax=unclassified Burkholderia TaxID=2613784 RepID=UPI00075E10E3|nr:MULTISPECIES: PAS domain S-box protein [unclassified Burkholderia]KVN07976.1 histidine kinase [Burkholderia sp. MSMB1552]KWZ51550.1 histidine kinase [Burkholderia sp. MSMB1588]